MKPRRVPAAVTGAMTCQILPSPASYPVAFSAQDGPLMGLSWPRWRIMLGDGVQNGSEWPKMTSKTPPRWPKRPPRLPQTPPRRPRTGPRRRKSLKKQWFFNDFYSSASRCRGSFRRPLRSPTGAPRLPKMALRRPKMAPRRPKMPPRRPKMAPEVAQKRPKMVPRRPPEDLLSAPTPLRDAAREPFGSRRPQGASRPPQNEPQSGPKMAQEAKI